MMASHRTQTIAIYHHRELLFALFLIVAVVTVTLLIFIPKLGLYLDDYMSWYLEFRFGTPAHVEFAAGQNRPLGALIPFLAGSAEGGHLWVFFSHTLNGVLIMLVIRTLWPQQRSLSTFAAILYCVYPGYWWHPQLISLNIDLSITFALLSLYLSLMAIRQKGFYRSLLTLISIVFVFGYFFQYEQPFGFEALRPLLFYFMGSTSLKTHVKRSLVDALPWLLIAGILFIYRAFIFEPFGYFGRAHYNVIAFPSDAQSVIARLQSLFQSLMDQFFRTWVIAVESFQGPATDSVGSLILIALLLMLLCGIYLWTFRKQDTAMTWLPFVQICLVGVLIAILGQVTVIVGADRQPAVMGPTSRWNLVPSIGVSLAWVTLLLFVCDLPRRHWVAICGRLILILAIGLGAFLHLLNVQEYVRDWETQRQFWWQLSWRAPSLTPQTVILIDGQTAVAQSRPRHSYETMISAALFYGDSSEIRALTTTEAGLFRDSPTYFWRVSPDTYDLGMVQWMIDFGQGLLVDADEGCIEIVSTLVSLPDGKTLSQVGETFQSIIPNPVRLISTAEPNAPYRYLFGPEPEHGWCYYYQQAQLAAQLGDFDRVQSLRQRVIDMGLQPEVPSEWNIYQAESE